MVGAERDGSERRNVGVDTALKEARSCKERERADVDDGGQDDEDAMTTDDEARMKGAATVRGRAGLEREHG